MIHLTPGPLPIHFFSIVVKASAVDRSFAEGRDDFIRAHDPGSYNGALFCLPSMGLESVEWRLQRLAADGIVLGVDAVLADMEHGPEVDCPGLVFACEGEWFGAQWTVDVDPAHNLPEMPAEEAPVEPVQGVAHRPALTPSARLRGTPAESSGGWRRHVEPGGQVYWFGGEDNE